MTPTPRLPAGVRRLFRLRWSRAHIARDLDDELRFHLEMRMSELESRGLAPTDAEMEALRRLGDVDDLRAYCMRTDEHAARLARAGDWVAELLHDGRLAARQFRRAPAFTALAVFTLALGIGANTAIFSVVHALLLDPLPYTEGDRIVALRQQAGDGDMLFPPEGQALREWTARSRTVDAISAVSTGRVTLGSLGEADTAFAAAITPGFMTTVRVRPEIGRGFSIEDLRAGDPGTVVISHALWNARFDRRQDVLGRVLRINGKPRTIIGVMPSRTSVPFTHGPEPDLWLPLDPDHIAGSANGIARLRPGVTPEKASRELQAILEASPDASRYSKTRARAMRSQEFLDNREVRTIEILFAAVGVLLLIACANVANLLHARSWIRRKEFAIRAALGAGRGRLVRQVLAESAMLALVAGVVGVLIAWLGLRAIVGLRPPTLVELAGVGLEPAVLAWNALITVATVILFGSIPALFSGSRAVTGALHAAGRAAGSASSTKLRAGIVVLEIALSVMLLIGAALLARSFVALQRMSLGYEPHALLSIGTFARGGDVNRRDAVRGEVLDRLRAIPGVDGAAIGSLPGQAWTIASPIEADGNNALEAPEIREFTNTFVSPGYFRVANIAIVAGRTLDSSLARSAATNVDEELGEVLINVTLAKRLWRDGNAVGRRIRTNHSGPWSTVVGVVNDVRMPGARDDTPAFQLYTLPNSRIPGLAYVVRTTAPSTVIPAIRRSIAELGADLAVGTVTTGDEYLRQSLAPSRFAMALLGTFSVVALVLSVIGLYGVIAFAVSQRTREIGIRVALGADSNAVAKLVIGDGLRLAALGVSIGLAGAIATSRALDNLLYGVTASDPVSFAAIPLLLGVTALAATYVPARRALHVDPVEALRAE